jgi:hypothetical protein
VQGGLQRGRVAIPECGGDRVARAGQFVQEKPPQRVDMGLLPM